MKKSLALSPSTSLRVNSVEGFTLIEVLVVISIMVIFIGIALPQYNTYSEQIKLKNEAKKLVDVLELAKKKALSADLENSCDDFTGYRVEISQSSYSLSFGCASTYSIIKEYGFPTTFSITTGIGNYDFPPLMNRPNFVTNTIKLQNSSINGVNNCVTITVSPIGIVELNETLISC